MSAFSFELRKLFPSSYEALVRVGFKMIIRISRLTKKVSHAACLTDLFARKFCGVRLFDRINLHLRASCFVFELFLPLLIVLVTFFFRYSEQVALCLLIIFYFSKQVLRDAHDCLGWPLPPLFLVSLRIILGG